MLPLNNVEKVSSTFNTLQGSGKKQASKYELHMRAQKRKQSSMKQQRAVPMSIEGRNMSL
jgi:hypothetical protein